MFTDTVWSSPATTVIGTLAARVVKPSPAVMSSVKSPGATLSLAVPMAVRSVKKTLLPRNPTSGGVPPLTWMRASIGVPVTARFTLTVTALCGVSPVKSCATSPESATTTSAMAVLEYPLATA